MGSAKPVNMKNDAANNMDLPDSVTLWSQRKQDFLQAMYYILSMLHFYCRLRNFFSFNSNFFLSCLYPIINLADQELKTAIILLP